LRVLTGIPKAERWPELRAAALEHVLTLTRRLARFTVIDCGFSLEDDEELSYDTLAPRRNAATLTSLAVADTLLAVGAGDPIGLQRLVRGLQELGPVASPSPKIVINKVRASAVGRRPERHIRYALSRFAGVDDPRFIPDDPATLDRALLAGRSLAEAAPASEVRQALLALASEVSDLPAPQRRHRRRGA
jgi:Flp pilus assembly CpaE family ATPase